MAHIFISTGEVSGDLQGSLLIEGLTAEAQNRGLPLEITALGGDRMAGAGAELLANTAAIGSVGLTESLRFILPTWQIQRRVKAFLKERPVDLLILIDYLGPNLAIARYARRVYPQLKIFYYIAPQAWVWSPSAGDTQRLVAVMDHLLAIFPQEARFFREQGVSVTWVGHPLLDRLQGAPPRLTARDKLGLSAEKTAITLLPASRIQEIHTLLPLLAESAGQLQAQLPQVQFLLPVSLPAYRDKIEEILKPYGLNITLLDGADTLTAISAADLALCKSGTVNLEIALLGVPQVVVYKVSPLTRWVAERILKFDAPFVSPVNIVLQRETVPELLQDNATPDRVAAAALDFLQNPQRRSQLAADYRELRQALGEPGVCQRAAGVILDFLESQTQGNAPTPQL